MKSKLYFLFLFFILTSSQILLAQKQRADSLENVLNHHLVNNPEKVDLMNEIAYSIFSNDPQKAMRYAAESAKLSNELNYTKGKAVSLWITGLAYHNNNKRTAIKYFEESLRIAQAIKEQTVICNCLIGIGNIQNDLGEPKKSDESFEQALQVANKTNDKNLLLKCLVNIARNYSTKGEYAKAIEVLDKSIKLAEELNDNTILWKAFNNLAWIYSIQSNYSVALEYHLKALKINDQLHNQSGMVTNYLNIAGIKSDQKEYDEALKYLHRALHISEEIKDSLKMSLSLSTIGNIYLKKDAPRALEYYEKSLKIIGNNSVNQTIGILTSMGTIYTQQENFIKAIDCFNEALSLAKKKGLKRAIADIWSKIGLVYFHQKRYSEALDYSNKSLVIADELKLLNLQKDLYKQLSEIYAATNNYQAAYKKHYIYKIYNDSIFNETNVKKLADLESAYKYEKEKQVYEITVQNKELKIKSQQGVIIFLVVAFILLSSLGIMTVHSQKLKKRLLNLELEEANAELERNQKEMTSATLKLVQTAERDIRSIKMLESIEVKINSEVRDDIKSLIFDYKSQAYKSNWEEFEILFQKIHASFYEKLNNRFPMLTQNERKLCVFLKLNMNNKQIAQITFQSEEALKKARLRLRKKLDLERDTNLVSFIQSI